MKTPAEWKTLFESSAFARQTTYSGPLGPEYNPSGTRLRLWAPTAQKVSVNLYRRGDGGACMGTLPLEQHGQGVWSVYLPGDQHGHYYTFTVEVDGTAYETGDPYARTAGVNGLRSMILDAPRIDPPDWNHDHRVIVPASRRTVWEVSVRDFSQDPACGVRNAWRGKFMAFTEGDHPFFRRHLPHLPRLPQAAGVGYVQLMPIFDFGGGREPPLTRQYNWGYDPTNYNVPEGSYSTDPRRRSPGAGVQGDDSRPPRGGHRRHHGCGVQSYVPQREPAEQHGALLFLPAEPGRQLLQRQRLRQRVCQ